MNKNLKDLINDFIDSQIEDMEENGWMCLDMCEEENNFHMTTYWLEYPSKVEAFLNRMYKEKDIDFSILCNEIINMYPNNIENLRAKIGDIKFNDKAYLTYECLNTILLKEFQKLKVWYTVYGCEEEDYVDFNKHNIINALTDEDSFPVLKSEDLTAAMLGISTFVQPSDMYDIFAHRSNDLLSSSEPVFTPDHFQYEGVVGRNKCYQDIETGIKKRKNSDLIDYVMKLRKIESESNILKCLGNSYYLNSKALGIAELIQDKYLNQFSKPPYSFPLSKDNLSIIVDPSINNEPKLNVIFKIRGIKEGKNIWKEIYNKEIDVPIAAEEVQMAVIRLANEIKVALSGKEKERGDGELAIEGLYPRKNLVTHGLKAIKNLNIKNREAEPQFSLSLAEKQSSYIIKKSLRYSNNPVLSCSFGNDSIVTLSLIRKVTKKDFKNHLEQIFPLFY